MGKIPASVVLFDYGNTLVMDQTDDVIDSVLLKHSTVKSVDYLPFEKLDKKELAKKWKEANGELNWPFASHFSQEEPFIQHALREMGVGADDRARMAPRILGAYRESLYGRLEQDRKQAEIVRDAVGYLKSRGKTVGVVSNDREWAPKAALSKMGVFDLFDRYYTSEGLTRKYGETLEKPSYKVFTKVSEEMGVGLENICYVGDDQVRDVETPKRLGMKAILYMPPEKYRKSEKWRDYGANVKNKPDAVIEDLREIRQMQLII